jgi:hypothetical protein
MGHRVKIQTGCCGQEKTDTLIFAGDGTVKLKPDVKINVDAVRSMICLMQSEGWKSLEIRTE